MSARKAKRQPKARTAIVAAAESIDVNELAKECVEELRKALKVIFVVTTALEAQGCDADGACAEMLDSIAFPHIEGVRARLEALAKEGSR